MSKSFSLLLIFGLLFCWKSTAETKDYYAILGVSRSATAEEIKSAFRRRARETHPDLVQDPREKEARAEKFKIVNEAHEILSDPNLRRNYDKKGISQNYSHQTNPTYTQRKAQQAYQQHSQNYFKPSELIMRSLAAMKTATVDEKIIAALKLMDQLLTNPIHLRRQGITDIRQYTAVANSLADILTRVGYWTQYSNSPSTSEAVCKAAFLWLKNFKEPAPELFDRYYNYGYESIWSDYQMNLRTPGNDSEGWAKSKENVLNFAQKYKERGWYPQGPSCNIFSKFF